MARKTTLAVGAVSDTKTVVAALASVSWSAAVVQVTVGLDAVADRVVSVAVLLVSKLSFTSGNTFIVLAHAIPTRGRSALNAAALSISRGA